MTRSAAAALAALMILSSGPAFGQTVDTATERARLANQRIQAEAEQRAREEQARQGQPAALSAAPAAQPAPSEAAAPAGVAPAARGNEPVSEAVTSAPAPSRQAPTPEGDPTSLALQQLRELGELKDAGYLTDEEFRRIKARILERRF